ncbi:MAG: hypothetical protein EXR47_03730 [Dehalococcoidia bacterium]|nr:hypothetical protein [Dehalococcoidia bacterium]
MKTTRTPSTTDRELRALQSSVNQCLEVVQELKTAVADLSVVKPTVIYDLSKRYVLNQPLLILLEESGDECVTASWPELHPYAEGDTPTEAIGHLKDQIVRLYKELSQTPPEQLGVLPRRWLGALQRVVRAHA